MLGTNVTGNQVLPKRVTMAYNALGQRTQIARFQSTATANPVATTDFRYGTANRVSGIAHKQGATNLNTYAYTYDPLSRLASVESTLDGLTSYTWDHRNRLTQVTERTQTNTRISEINYEYDAFNRLVRRYDALVASFTPVTYWVYDEGTNPLLEYFGGDRLIQHRYLWSDNVDDLLADEQNPGLSSRNTLWALSDHLGSIRDIADTNESTGTTSIANHRRYDSFGRRVWETNDAVDLVFGYTGKLFDETTRLQNNLNRWYDSSTGRWISQDPIGFAGGDANLYRYTGNSPTNSTDPSGLEGEWWRDSGWDYLNPFAYSAWGGNGIGYGVSWIYYGPSNMAADVNMRHQIKVGIAQNMRRDNNVQGTGEASYMRETERQYTELHARGNYEFYGVATGMATPMGGGGSTSGTTAGKILDDWADDAFQVIKHGSNRPRPVGSQSHHGVMSAWMRSQSSKYNPDLAPAILMSRKNHEKTFGAFNKWYAEKSKAMGGKFDWKKVSESDIRTLSEKMFDAASVPANIRQEYWDWFERMKNALEK